MCSIPEPSSVSPSMQSGSLTKNSTMAPAMVSLSMPLIATLRSTAAQEATSFPFKLYEMLEKEDEAIVSWQPHGHAFAIRDSKLFATNVLPRYFPDTLPSSLQRHLGLFGFKRITKGRDAGCYYHEHFVQGRQDLLPCVHRSKMTKAKDMDTADAPDFYKASTRQTSKSLAQAIQQVQMLARDEEIPLSKKIQPLRPPGRLLYQDAETPTAMRFVKTRKDATLKRRMEALRWSKPIQPISMELDGHDWAKNTKVQTEDKTTAKKPTLDDIIFLLE